MGMRQDGVQRAGRLKPVCRWCRIRRGGRFFPFLPPEHDPDSYVRESGPEAFDALVKKAMPLSEFLLEEIVGDNNLNTLEGRARAQHTAKSLCASLTPSALRLQILRRLAQITQTPDGELEKRFWDFPNRLFRQDAFRRVRRVLR